jgi:hypothetical protein
MKQYILQQNLSAEYYFVWDVISELVHCYCVSGCVLPPSSGQKINRTVDKSASHFRIIAL